jgi:hypothetical protein
MDSPVNMTWAPNGRGGHKTSALRALVDDLERAGSGNIDDVYSVLKEHGEIAYRKGINQ